MNTLLRKGAIYTSLAGLSATGLYYICINPKFAVPPSKPTNMLPPYQATFSVPLSCNSCIEDISAALSNLPGIDSTTFSLPSQLLTTTGTAPPSAIISTIQSTGRPAVLRGSGASNSAAVCIFELPPQPNSAKTSTPSSPVRGLARLVQLSRIRTLLDLSLSALPPGTYIISLRSTGDISDGVASMGPPYRGDSGDRKGELGRVVVDEKGMGNLVGEVEWEVWEMVGRGILVRREAEGNDTRKTAGDVAMGVVARSAGVWENEKVVCACSGKTVWEEREEMRSKGIA